jgi:hypothetical protein
MSGRHAAGTLPAARRGGAVLLTAATVLGLWFGLRAPDVSQVAVPTPATVAQPAGTAVVAPVVPPQDDPGRGGGGRR